MEQINTNSTLFTTLSISKSKMNKVFCTLLFSLLTLSSFSQDLSILIDVPTLGVERFTLCGPPSEIEVTATNTTGSTITAVTSEFDLPAGFVYVPGSVVGATESNASTPLFNLGDIAANAAVTFTVGIETGCDAQTIADSDDDILFDITFDSPDLGAPIVESTPEFAVIQATLSIPSITGNATTTPLYDAAMGIVDTVTVTVVNGNQGTLDSFFYYIENHDQLTIQSLEVNGISISPTLSVTGDTSYFIITAPIIAEAIPFGGNPVDYPSLLQFNETLVFKEVWETTSCSLTADDIQRGVQWGCNNGEGLATCTSTFTERSSGVRFGFLRPDFVVDDYHEYLFTPWKSRPGYKECYDPNDQPVYMTMFTNTGDITGILQDFRFYTNYGHASPYLIDTSAMSYYFKDGATTTTPIALTNDDIDLLTHGSASYSGKCTDNASARLIKFEDLGISVEPGDTLIFQYEMKYIGDCAECTDEGNFRLFQQPYMYFDQMIYNDGCFFVDYTEPTAVKRYVRTYWRDFSEAPGYVRDQNTGDICYTTTTYENEHGNLYYNNTNNYNTYQVVKRGRSLTASYNEGYSPMCEDCYTELVYIIGGGLDWDGISGDLASPDLVWADGSGDVHAPIYVNYVDNESAANDTLIVRYPRVKSEDPSVTFDPRYGAKVTLQVRGDCEEWVPHCSPTGYTLDPTVNVKSEYYFVLNPNCTDGPCREEINSPKSTPMLLDCPNCACEGLVHTDMEFRRQNFGYGDNDNDGIVDAGETIDPNLVQENRFLIGDTLKAEFGGKIVSSSASTWDHGFAIVKVPTFSITGGRAFDKGNFPLGAEVTIYDADGGTYSCDVLQQFIGGPENNWLITNFSPGNLSTLGCSSIPAGFEFATGDSIALSTFFKVTDYYRDQIEMTFNTEFYVSDEPYDLGVHYQCNSLPQKMTYLSYYMYNKWRPYDIYECNNNGYFNENGVDDRYDYHHTYFNIGWSGDQSVDFFNYEIRQVFLPKEMTFTKGSDLDWGETIRFYVYDANGHIGTDGVGIRSAVNLFIDISSTSNATINGDDLILTFPGILEDAGYDDRYDEGMVLNVGPPVSPNCDTEYEAPSTFKKMDVKTVLTTDENVFGSPEFTMTDTMYNQNIAANSTNSNYNYVYDTDAPYNDKFHFVQPNTFAATSSYVQLKGLPKVVLQTYSSEELLAQETTCFEMDVTNLGDLSSSNTFVSWESPSGGVILHEVLDPATGDPYPENLGIIEIGDVDLGETRAVRLCVASNNCQTDSIIVNTGWACDGYPGSTEEIVCSEPQTLRLKSVDAFLGMEILSPDPANTLNIDLCDTVEFVIKFNSADLGYLYDLLYLFRIPNAADYVAGSFDIAYPVPVDGSDTTWVQSIEEPQNIFGNIWKINVSNQNSVLSTDGFVGTTNIAENFALIRFKVVTDCGFKSPSRVKMTSRAKNACGQITNKVFLPGPKMRVNGISAPFLSDLAIGNVPDVNACSEDVSALNISYSIQAGSQVVGAGDSILIELPEGVEYVPNSYVPGPNSVPAGPTVPIDGGQEIIVDMPDGLSAGQSASFTLNIKTIDVAQDCGNYEVIVSTFNSQSAFCAASGTTCNVRSVSDEQIRKINVVKPTYEIENLSLTAITLPPNQDSLLYCFDLINNGEPIPNGQTTTVSLMADVNENGDYDEGIDVLLADVTTQTAIPTGNTANVCGSVLVESGLSCSVYAYLDMEKTCSCEPFTSFRTSADYVIPFPSKDFEACSDELIPSIGPDSMANTTYEWVGIDGADVTFLSELNTTPVAFQMENPTTQPLYLSYYLRSELNDQCGSVDTVNITVYPTQQTQKSTQNCITNDFQLAGPIGYTNYVWTGGNGGFADNTDPLTMVDVNLYTPGQHTFVLEYEDGNGCQAFFTQIVTLINCSNRTSVGNYVWCDANYNGLQDIDEEPLVGVPVNLFSGTDLITPIATAFTDATGYFNFGPLTAQDYAIGIPDLIADQYVGTTKNAGSDPELDSDINPNTLITDIFYLPNGDSLTNYDIGLLCPLVDIDIEKEVYEMDHTTEAEVVTEGDTVIWDVVICNRTMGPPDTVAINATDVYATDNLPQQVEYVSYSATSGTYDDVTGVWYIPQVDNGTCETLSITTRVSTSFEQVFNVAQIDSLDQPDIDSTDWNANEPLTSKACYVEITSFSAGSCTYDASANPSNSYSIDITWEYVGVDTDFLLTTSNGLNQVVANDGSENQTYTITGLTADEISNIEFKVSVVDEAVCFDNEFYGSPAPCCPLITASNDAAICIGETTQLSVNGQPNYTYTWSPAIGLSCITCANPVASPAATTVYTVTSEDNSGCIRTDDVIITVNPLPTPDFFAPEVCATIATPFTDLTPASQNVTGWLWDFDDNGNTSTAQNPNYTFTTDGEYNVSLTVTTVNGCSVKIFETVTVHPQLIADAGVDVEICAGESIQLAAQGGTIFEWAPTGSLNDANIFDPIASPLATTTYSVTVTNDFGCTGTDNVTVTVIPVPTITAVSSADVTDCNTDNGTITVTASGTGGTLEYTINNGSSWETTGSYTNLAAGSYTILVRYDDETCPVSYVNNPVIISAPNAAEITDVITVEPNGCSGASNGSIEIVASGGSGSLEYSIDGGTTWQAGNTFSGLAAGSYPINVRNDDGSCEVVASTVVFDDPVTPTITAVNATDVSDCGANDGTISIIATGNMVLEYSIDNTTWQSGNAFINLAAGTYTAYVRYQDGSCSASQANVVIAEPTAPSITTVVSSNPTDCGVDDGTITITAVAGSAAVEYSIDGGVNWQANGSFSSLSAGTYNIIVRNTGGTCEVPYATNPVVLVAPNTPSITDVVYTDVTDCGLTDGEIIITASGGTAPLQYSINGGTSYQASNTFSNLAAGTYNVVVTNANGSCDVTFPSITITAPTAPVISNVTVTDISDCAANDGTITIFASGTGGLEYSIDGGVNWFTTNVFNNLPAANNYTILVRNADGTCETPWGTLIEIDEPVAPSITGVTTANPSDCGIDDGTITVTATAGSAATEYSIDGGVNWQNTGSFTALAAGTYNVVVRNVDGTCEVLDTNNPHILTAPNAPSITNVISTDPNECNVNNGTITITATGGTAPLQYSIDGGTTFQASNSFTGLSGGTYNVVVTNANGSCDVTYPSIVLTAPVLPSYNAPGVEATDITDCGEIDGTITIYAAGNEPLEYSIDNGTTWQPSNVFINLTGGFYNIRIRNAANGNCVVNYPSNPVFIDTPIAPTFSGAGVSSTNPTDCNTDNGTITVTVNNGSANPEYSIDGGNTWNSNSVFTSLAAGTYNVVVRNDDGTCEIQFPSQTILVAPNMPTINDATFTDPTDCGLANGTISISASGGIAPLEYSINGGVSFVSNGGAFTGLSGGTYDIVVRNSNGTCDVTYPSVTLTDKVAPTFAANGVVVSDVTDCGLTDGTISVSANSSAAIEYTIDGGTTWQPSNVFLGLPAGTYDVRIRNADGTCEVDAPNDAVITAPVTATIDAVTSVDPSNCGINDGSITITSTAGSSATEYSIDGGLNWQSSSSFTGLSSGTYNLVIRNDDGTCEVVYPSNPVVLDAPTAPSISDVTFTQPTECGVNDGTITITATGGIAPYEYSIDGGTTFVTNGGQFINLSGGTYNVIVRNAGGSCEVTYPSITLVDKIAPVYVGAEVEPTDVTECGLTDGTITIFANGGTGLEYSIDGGTIWQSSNLFLGLAPGSYNVSVRNDDETCQVDYPTATVIGGPAPPVYDPVNGVVATDPSNCNIDDGTITVNVTAGSSATEYSIDGGVNWQSSNSFAGLSAGTYNVFVRNNDGSCETPYPINPVILDAPNAPSITDAVFTDPTDCGLSNGTITITATGGTAPLQYSIDGGTTFVANGGSFTGLSGGNYPIVVSNADGSCEVTFPSITLTDEVAPVFDATAFVVTDVTDCGEVDGTITVNATSAEPIEYSIDGGTTWQPSNIFSGLTAGTYDVRIRNASGTCMVDAPTDAVITAPVAPVYDANAVVSTDPTDCDTDNGTITINNTAGSSATEYSIDGGINWQSGNVFSGLAAGTYNITIRNSADGTCEVPYANNPVILDAPNAPSITDAVFMDPTDCNLADGTITVTAIGGTAPLQYSIDGGTTFVANGGTFTGLAGGTYNIVVTNADGTCDVTFPSITLTDEVAPVFDATAFVVTDVTDCGEVDGTITVNATSAEPIEYSIDGGTTWQPSNIFSGLTAGTYDVRIRNASGTCMVDAPTDAVITAPVAPVYDANAVVSTDPTDCDTDNGTITINNTAGSSATEYSIDGGINWQSGNVFSGLAAGTYNITIRNSADGTCEVPYANNPVILDAPNAPSITDAVFTDPTDCNLADGTITVTAIGGTAPLQYSIDGGTTFVANGGTFTGLAGGTYNIVVTNADGTCDVTFPSITLTDEVAPVFDATAFVVTDVTDCGEVDGTITVNATSAEPIEYSIDGGTTWQPSNIFSGLTAGTYDVRIRNASGTCMVDAPTDAVITAPVAPVYDANAVVSTDPTDCDTDNGTITINNTAGSSATEYSIDGGINWQSGNVFSGLAAGTYNITIRNSADGTCEVPYANNPVILDAPNAPSITDAVFTDPTDCNLADGTITVTAIGGTAPLQYSIDGGTTFVANGGTFTGLAGGTLQYSSDQC